MRCGRGGWRHTPVRAALSPDSNPIENAFSKLKSLLRRLRPETVDNLWRFISDCMDAFTAAECKNYFAYFRYDAF